MTDETGEEKYLGTAEENYEKYSDWADRYRKAFYKHHGDAVKISIHTFIADGLKPDTEKNDASHEEGKPEKNDTSKDDVKKEGTSESSDKKSNDASKNDSRSRATGSSGSRSSDSDSDDGRFGQMLTGWQTIDGKEYYFETEGDKVGRIYANERTPDGHYVGADGVKIR